MSGNHLHLIDPSKIVLKTKNQQILHSFRSQKEGVLTIAAEVSESSVYEITSVSPLLINNDELVNVSFSASSPSSDDWIGAYSPASADVSATAPVKFGLCSTLNPDYLQSGSGSLQFNLTNLREDVKFYYFAAGLETPLLVAESAQNVSFIDRNEPLRNRIVPISSDSIDSISSQQRDFAVLWSSASSTQPLLRWGTASGEYTYSTAADSSSVTKSDLCAGGAATGVGWRDVGRIHNASFGFTSLSQQQQLALSNADVYYIFGDAATGDFSSEKKFHVPPLPGTQPPNRPTQVVLLADMGIGSTDGSYDTTVWEESCPPAANTSFSIGHRVLQGEVDAIFHSGDIAYANGYLSNWDFFMDLISPMAGGAVYLTTVGNHESDWPGTASLYPTATASGGECGVLSLRMLPMPQPATVNKPWWSYNVGLIHFVGMSTEHNYTVGSEQHAWLENDLRAVNRSITPWVIFSGHRSLYVDSNYCCEWGIDDCAVCTDGSDVGVMETMQANIEPLLFQYQVNLYFAGHFHNVERQAAILAGDVVQNAALTYSELLGEDVYLHENPKATVYMVIGTAGNGPDPASEIYSWSEKYWDSVFGYALVTAVNSTSLYWQMINSANDEVIDRVVITQDFSSWSAGAIDDDNSSGGGGGSSSSSSSDKSSGWDSLNAAEQGAVIAFSVLGGLLILCAFAAYIAVVFFGVPLPFMGSSSSSTFARNATSATTSSSPAQADEVVTVSNPVHTAQPPAVTAVAGDLEMASPA